MFVRRLTGSLAGLVGPLADQLTDRVTGPFANSRTAGLLNHLTEPVICREIGRLAVWRDAVMASRASTVNIIFELFLVSTKETTESLRI